MLVVIGIILSVAVVALPSITSLSKSSSRRTAVSLTMTALDQARGVALSHSTTAFLVFADGDAAWPLEYRNRAFAIFEESYEPATETYHRNLVGTWILLPAGVAFTADDDTIFGAPREKFYCHPTQREQELPCFKFTDIGSVASPAVTKYARLRVFEGFYNETGGRVTTNPAREAAEQSIKVSLLTGRARFDTTTNATN